ncbi:hypothetical protein HPP92_020041 [Vanilla planifolia]|uniref:Uncharacterized protein n=1 Tax=Vanilla planifolia TaxID=51239 RepID=A0A835UJH4_VANPL|nr:hypothetical protein HPP92_020041 [Vanilla planifolia]
MVSHFFCIGFSPPPSLPSTGTTSMAIIALSAPMPSTLGHRVPSSSLPRMRTRDLPPSSQRKPRKTPTTQSCGVSGRCLTRLTPSSRGREGSQGLWRTRRGNWRRRQWHRWPRSLSWWGLVRCLRTRRRELVQGGAGREYIEWLNGQEKGSVVYVSFGSISVLKKEQMEEIWMGLRETERPYLWGCEEGQQVGRDRDTRKDGGEGEGKVVAWERGR